MIKQVDYKKSFSVDNFPSIISEFIITILGFIPIFITFGIVGIFLFETWEFFREVSIFEFLTSTEWTPNFSNPQFGIIVLLAGTFFGDCYCFVGGYSHRHFGCCLSVGVCP